MSNIEERVKKIIVEQLGVKEEDVKPAASFVDDLGADSLDTLWKKSLIPRSLMKKLKRSLLFKQRSITFLRISNSEF